MMRQNIISGNVYHPYDYLFSAFHDHLSNFFVTSDSGCNVVYEIKKAQNFSKKDF